MDLQLASKRFLALARVEIIQDFLFGVVHVVAGSFGVIPLLCKGCMYINDVDAFSIARASAPVAIPYRKVRRALIFFHYPNGLDDRTRAEPRNASGYIRQWRDIAAWRQMAGAGALTGLPMSTSKLQAGASENRFLLGDNDLLWMAQDFQPNIHIDDIHYDLSWPRQQQGDL